MPTSNPGACTNCNIQNSNPSINNNAANNNQGNDPNKINIQKRYNPGASPGSSVNSSTSSAIAAVENVAQQTAFQGAGASQAKQAQTANQNTLNILNKLLNVQQDIQVIDTGAINTRKTARTSVSKNSNDVDTEQKTAVVVKEVEQKGRDVHILTPQQKEEKKKVKTSDVFKNRHSKSVGTELASSPSFQAKFASLVEQNIATEAVKIEFGIPDSFDGRKVWGPYIAEARSQGLCGSCYAFASVFTLQTRLAIYTKGKYNYILSPAKLIFCGISGNKTDSEKEFENRVKTALESGDHFDFKMNTQGAKSDVTYGCAGENLINAWQYLYRYGVPEDKCFFYGDEKNITAQELTTPDLTNTDDIGAMCTEYLSGSYDICPSTKKRMISHRAGGFYVVPGKKSDDPNKPSGSEFNIRKEIYKWGPCTSGIMVYQDFIDWDGRGIYQYDGKSAKIGGHAIVLMGWGESNGKKYWIVRNSWGSDWGVDRGYFKVLRGSNHCEIEENVITGFPNIPAIRLFADYPMLFQKEDLITQTLWQIRDSGIKETTLEQLALGKITETDILENTSYDIKSFPNFYSFLAGQMATSESFQYECRRKKSSQYIKIFLILILLAIFYLL
jgi:C1A family cysteine protease